MPMDEDGGGQRAGRDERHAIFSRWIYSDLLMGAVDGAGGAAVESRVWDVAGGKGHLSMALAELGVPSALVDPCAGTGRQLSSAGFFVAAMSCDVGAAADLGSSGDVNPGGGEQSEREPAQKDGGVSQQGGVLVMPLTLREAVDRHPDVLGRCCAIVGLHPDEATEEIVDIAISLNLPFAVIPCCVLPQLFPTRRLRSSGAAVKKTGAFIEYLREKDTRMRVAQLPFDGRNTVVYMTAQDYARKAKWWSKRPTNWQACAGAAKAGDLERLKELRAGGDCPWSEEAAQAAAWGGHLDVLKWMRADGCPWGHSTVAAATRGGHTEMLEWLVSQDCPAVPQENQAPSS